jgi:hypothetical protein
MRSSTAIRLKVLLAAAICSLFGLAGCGDETVERDPRLLDSPADTPEEDAETERLRKLQDIRLSAKLNGCIPGVDLMDRERYPATDYYFGPVAAGATCPTGCTAQANGTCVSSICASGTVCLSNDKAIDIVTETATAGSVYSAVMAGLCEQEGLTSNCGASSAPTNSCSLKLCGALNSLCRAHAAVQIASPRADSIKTKFAFWPSGSGEFSIPPQSTETNEAIFEEARTSARGAATQALAGLRDGLDIEDATFCSVGDLNGNMSGAVGANAGNINGRPRIDLLAQVLNDAYDVYIEATNGAVDATVAAAQAARSAPDRETAAERQQVGSKLSNAAAAHLLVGGNPGLKGARSELGLGTLRPLSEGGEKALGLMRQAALCPADVMATGSAQGSIATQDLIYSITDYNGPSSCRLGGATVPCAGVPTNGSVIQRLSDQGLLSSSAGNEYFFDTQAVTVDHFDEARQRLVQEYALFAKSITFAIPPPTGKHFSLFPATRTPPSPRPTILYAGAARDSRDSTGHVKNETSNTTLGMLAYGNVDNLADFMDGTFILASETLLSGNLSQLNNRAAYEGTIGELTQRIATTYKGRLEVCYLSGEANAGDFRVTAKGPANALILNSTDALQCAVGGTIDGAGCGTDLAQYRPTWTLAERAAVSNPLRQDKLFKHILEAPHLIINLNTVSELYLSEFGDPSVARGLPGDFKATASAAPKVSRCTVAPIVPDIYERAGALLQPNPDSPDEPAQECDGTSANDKIPLEDELSQDNDGIESSWKHYLELAKTAATEADRLAEEYVQAGITLDERDESIELRQHGNDVAAVGELETVQRICGTNVDPAEILQALRADGAGSNDFTKLVVAPTGCTGSGCTCATGYQCPSGYSCYANRCLSSPVSELNKLKIVDPELKKLLRCLGEERNGTLTAVTAGDRDLCYWRSSTDPSLVCRDPAYESCLSQPTSAPELCTKRGCPFVATGEGDNTFCAAGPTGTEIHKTDARLDYFPTPESQDVQIAGQAEHEICGRLRALRELSPGDERDTKVGQLPSKSRQNLFLYDEVSRIVNKLRYEAEAKTYFTVTLGDQPWVSTGSWLNRVTPETLSDAHEWPCYDEFACGGSNQHSLFCKTINCTDESQRAAMASRVRDAMVALNMLAGDNIELRQVDPPAFVKGTETGQRDTSQAVSLQVNHLNVRYAYPGDGASTPQGIGSVTETFDIGDSRYYRYYKGTGQYEQWERSVPSGTNFSVWLFAEDSAWNPDKITVRDAEVLQNLSYSDLDNAFRDELTGENPELWRGLAKDGPGGIDAKGGSGVVAQLLRGALDKDIKTLFQTFGGDNNELTRVLDEDTFLDGIEMYCMAAAEPQSPAATGQCMPRAPRGGLIRRLEDLNDVANDLICFGQSVQESAGKSLIFDLPQQAVDALRELSAVGATQELGGDLAEAVTAVRSNLIELYAAAPLIASQINQLGLDTQQLTGKLKSLDLEDQINGKLNEQKALAEIGRCHESIAQGANQLLFEGQGLGGLGVAAVACINSGIQVGLIAQIGELQTEMTAQDVENLQSDFRQRFEDRSQALGQIAADIADVRERLDGNLARIDNLRLQARRALDQAVWLSSYQASQQFNIGAALKGRFNGTRKRYLDAFGYARKVATLARRSIEARIGERLEDMDQPLPLVDAPRTWVNTLCKSSPLDYSALRTPSDDEEGDASRFADAFIGDYVRKLDGVIESYRLVKNFHEGSDTTVVSLRDDVFRTRRDCDVPSNNLLLTSGRYDASPWTRTGCGVDSNGNEKPSCANVSAAAKAGPNPEDGDGSAGANLITFGYRPDASGNRVSCGTTCGLSTDTRLGQTVALSSGEYLLSWYGKKVTVGGNADSNNPTGATSVTFTCDGAFQTMTAQTPSAAVGTTGWTRYTTRYKLTKGGQACTVSIVPTGTNSHQVLIAGLMLEKANDKTLASSFESTSPQGTITRPNCEDSDGQVFRETAWEPGALTLCDNGFSGNCSDDLKSEHRFRWLTFTIDQGKIEKGELFGQSGFALGNFNYRIDTLGLNFVGTDVRDCKDSDSPQACYSAGFVPYSMIHNGPYTVRNYSGGDFDVPLFVGNIEHARGLATERYLTNPISDTDRSLIGDYMREEFQGRPLDGTFVIRVWEDEGFDFDQIQDVQLVLNYSYWTRFN